MTLKTRCQVSLNSRPRPREIKVLILRFGILGVFVAALCGSLVSFALFGCECIQGRMPEQIEIPKEEMPASETKGAPRQI